MAVTAATNKRLALGLVPLLTTLFTGLVGMYLTDGTLVSGAIILAMTVLGAVALVMDLIQANHVNISCLWFAIVLFMVTVIGPNLDSPRLPMLPWLTLALLTLVAPLAWVQIKQAKPNCQ
jgi:hypothetical protein